MVQTYFPVAGTTDIETAFGAITNGGSEAAINTNYTIALTAPISLIADAVVDLDTGSTLKFEGDALITTGQSLTLSGTVTLDLNYTGTITLDGGTITNVALTTNSGGTVIAGYYTGEIYGPSGFTDIAINDGTITNSGSEGVIDIDAGTVENGWDGTTAALLSGSSIGVELGSSGLVQNAGSIMASDNGLGDGVYSGAAGTVYNGTDAYTGAQITGDDFGVDILGAGLVVNDGTITGSGGAGVDLGSGTVDNGDSADTTATITSTGPGSGVEVDNSTGIVNNFGTISAPSGVGVYLVSGGTVTNGTTADTGAQISAAFEGVQFVAAGDVYNYGTIVADGDDTLNSVIGAWLENGGTVENIGSLSQIDGEDWGVIVQAASAYVQNAGTISALGGVNADGIGVDLQDGGSVQNGFSAGVQTITGTYDGVRVEGAGVAGAVVNDGTISGGVGVDFESTGGTLSSVANFGLIESTGGDSGYSVLFANGGGTLVLENTGSFVGSALGGLAPEQTSTLEVDASQSASVSWVSDDSGTVTTSGGTLDFSAFSEIVLSSASTLTLLTGAASTQTIEFLPALTAPTVLALSTPASTPDSVQATIQNFAANYGTIDLLGLANGSVTGFNYITAGSELQVLGAGNAVLADLFLPGNFISTSFMHAEDAAKTGTDITTNVPLPCFATGTAIDTARGAVCVEDLRVGDQVVCVGGGLRPVVWIGYRRVDIARHPAPMEVSPVRIRRGAFAENMPRRDLMLSPDHAVFVDDVLIPAKYLVNGSSIAQAAADEVEYWHIELDRHDVLFAEGLPAESYLETGNRSAFANGGGATMLHPIFAPTGDAVALIWEAQGCAPLVITGDAVRRVNERLAARVEEQRRAPARLPRAIAG